VSQEPEQTYSLVVSARHDEADGVVSLTLRRADGSALPPWQPGAHVDLLFGNGVERQYSLCSDPSDTGSWRIAVLREPDGRGGSEYVHTRLRAGMEVGVRGPRNHFELLPAERYEDLVSETAADAAANVQRIIQNEQLESGEVSAERVSLIRRIMFMNTKDRIKLARKGDREARSILIRDSNKVVCSAVVNNPRITEQEIENIASMRTVADEVLRVIALNRAWARSYLIIHNLARNPRTPIPTAMNILPRIRTKDLQSLTQNRNVSEAVRRQAYRLAQVRTGE